MVLFSTGADWWRSIGRRVKSPGLGSAGCVMVKWMARGSQPAAQTLLHNTIPTNIIHVCRRLPLLYTASSLELLVAPSTTLSPVTALLYYPAITRADTSPTFLPDHRPSL